MQTLLNHYTQLIKSQTKTQIMYNRQDIKYDCMYQVQMIKLKMMYKIDELQEKCGYLQEICMVNQKMRDQAERIGDMQKKYIRELQRQIGQARNQVTRLKMEMQTMKVQKNMQQLNTRLNNTKQKHIQISFYNNIFEQITHYHKPNKNSQQIITQLLQQIHSKNLTLSKLQNKNKQQQCILQKICNIVQVKYDYINIEEIADKIKQKIGWAMKQIHDVDIYLSGIQRCAWYKDVGIKERIQKIIRKVGKEKQRYEESLAHVQEVVNKWFKFTILEHENKYGKELIELINAKINEERQNL